MKKYMKSLLLFCFLFTGIAIFATTNNSVPNIQQNVEKQNKKRSSGSQEDKKDKPQSVSKELGNGTKTTANGDQTRTSEKDGKTSKVDKDINKSPNKNNNADKNESTAEENKTGKTDNENTPEEEQQQNIDESSGIENNNTSNELSSQPEDDDLSTTVLKLAITALIIIFIIFVLSIYIKCLKNSHLANESKKKIYEIDNLLNKNLAFYQNEINALKSRLQALENAQKRNPNNNGGLQLNMENSNVQQRPVTVQQPSIRTVFLGTPSSNGFFSSVSESKTYDTIVQLTTRDGRTGTFVFINERDSINTAILAVESLKIAFKINNISTMPSHIITNNEGVAEKINGQWRIINKGVITFTA